MAPISAKKLLLVFVLASLGPTPGVSETKLAAANAADQSATAAAPAANGHYIEFRVAHNGLYGHSYVVYGRANAQGKPIESRYTDHYPMGGYGGMAVGHVLPVPANHEFDRAILKDVIASSYRRSLTTSQYKNLLTAIQQIKANKSPYWNALTNNCNHFVGELAKAVGMKIPSGMLIAYAFVPAIRSMNDH